MLHRKISGLLCLFLAGGKLFAASENFLVDDWGTENGLPSSTVTSIAQTPDGYLWVGTYNGLARFDGARFVTFDPVSTPALTQTRVQGLFLDARGTLWINTFRGGLTSYRAGVFRNEWPDQPAFDLHTTLVSSSSKQVTFVTQYGEVLQKDFSAGAGWKIFSPPTNSLPMFQCADNRRTLWFLTRDAHILQFENGAFKFLPNDGGLAGSQIYTLVADVRGQVWAGAENEIARWNGNLFEALTPTNGDADIHPISLFPTKSGALWVLDGERLRKMSGRAWVAEATQWRGLLGPAAGRTMGAHEDRDGGLWFNHYGNGLFHITPDGKFQRLTSQENLPGDRVGAWFQGRDGGIWAGVDHGGLALLRDRKFHVVGPAEGLPARTALSVCEDAHHTNEIWIGTAGGGLSLWRDGKIRRFAVGASVSSDFVFAIAPRADGGLWLSAGNGEDLFQFQNGAVQHVSWDVHGIKSILTDRAGRVWMGTKNGIAFGAGGERRILGASAVDTLPSVRALAQTPDGNVWAGADDGTIYRCEPDKLTPFRPRDALADQPIYSLFADADGALWAGTFRGGLLRFKNGKFSRITDKQGLPADIISQILEDNRGRLWLGTHQGIYCVAKSELNAVADGGSNALNYVVYGRHDGLPALECSDGYQPACWRGADGKLWFTTVRGVVWVNPADVTAKSPPPRVVIEELRVDGELVESSRLQVASSVGAVAKEQKPATFNLQLATIIIPPGHKQFDFRFTALSFNAGDRARFRYQLAGFDSGWVNADTLRTAHYGPLPPNHYRFRVAACNSEGVWNETGATLDFEVQPFFYQTWWFKIFSGALVFGVLIFAVRRIVTRKYRRQLALLEQQHAIERDRARIAKDIHDDVGAGLTQITLLTELARREPEQTHSNLERIRDSARTLTRAMDEIVWAINPQHDTFDGLMDYISAYAEDFLRVAGIRCRMDLPVTLPATRVDAEVRYNLFLALKEALNNVVKHSQATEVRLGLHIAPHAFTLVVEDNGRGLAAANEASENDRLASGLGLENMKKRLAAIGGRCEIHSVAGQGTRIEMTVAMKPEASPVVVSGRGGEAD